MTELNRWARDGRLSPGGKRLSLLGGSYHRWLPPWLPATIEAAVSQIERWREQDKTRTSRADILTLHKRLVPEKRHRHAGRSCADEEVGADHQHSRAGLIEPRRWSPRSSRAGPV
jgi:hypothetical protein